MAVDAAGRIPEIQSRADESFGEPERTAAPGRTTMLRAVRYRVENFRNIDDSGWISLERVTAFVGRNESGKTALLKALHKFNPAIAEPYSHSANFLATATRKTARTRPIGLYVLWCSKSRSRCSLSCRPSLETCQFPRRSCALDTTMPISWSPSNRPFLSSKTLYP